MTKAIRIENADTANYKVVVEVYENGQIIDTFLLAYPAQLKETFITSTRHLVVRELPEPSANV